MDKPDAYVPEEGIAEAREEKSPERAPIHSI